MTDLETLQRRICDRSAGFPRVYRCGAVRSHLAALDHCSAVAVAFFATSLDAPDLPKRAEDRLFAEPKRWHTTTVGALREWAGPAPVYTVEPCPNWDEHEEVATGKRDPEECYYGCAYTPGLGYAYETQDRKFGNEGDADWGAIGGIIVDRARLAELLGPFEDCSVSWGIYRGALYVQHGDLWRIALMSAAADVTTKGPAFGTDDKLRRER